MPESVARLAQLESDLTGALALIALQNRGCSFDVSEVTFELCKLRDGLRHIDDAVLADLTRRTA